MVALPRVKEPNAATPLDANGQANNGIKVATYGYTRVSTARQVDEGESLGTQQRTLEGYAMMHDLTIDRVFTERGVSGSIPLVDRSEDAALLDVVKPGDVIVTAKLDRVFRSALDALAVLES